MKLLHAFGFTLVLSAIILLLLPACAKKGLEELEEEEQRIINKYLADNNISAETRTEGGIYFIETKAGTGISPVKDNYVVINYVGRYLLDGSIRETNYDSLRDEWAIAPRLENYYFGPMKLLYGYSMPGINEALSMMKEGGKATAIIPSDKANYDYKPLVYDLELVRVIEDLKRYEDSVINVYSGKYYGDTARIDTVGIWTRIDDAPATTNIFDSGDTLFFNFDAKMIDGFGDSVVAERIFDSNEGEDPLKYVYGQNFLNSGQMLRLQNNQLVKGLKTALDSLDISNGMKFSVLMTYDQAFGANGFIHEVDKYVIMPPYQSIEYDIEVTAIKPE